MKKPWLIWEPERAGLFLVLRQPMLRPLTQFLGIGKQSIVRSRQWRLLPRMGSSPIPHTIQEPCPQILTLGMGLDAGQKLVFDHMAHRLRDGQRRGSA